MPFRGRPQTYGLPEGTDYVDTGCSLHPLCLLCPEPRCRYDTPLGPRGMRYLATRDHAFTLLRRNLSARDVSHQTGVGIRTVFRLKRLLTKLR